MDERIFVGLMQLVLQVPGARTRKHRRQAVRSVVDRLRHRFDVSVHEVDSGDQPTRAVLVLTTAGNDRRLIRSILDRVEDLVASHGSVVLTGIDAEVERWHPEDTEAYLG